MPKCLCFQAGPDLWLVFQDEGPSLHSLMYSAKAMSANSPAQTPTAAAQRPAAAAQTDTGAAQTPTAAASASAISQRQLGQAQSSQDASEQGGDVPAADPSETEDAPRESQVHLKRDTQHQCIKARGV